MRNKILFIAIALSSMLITSCSEKKAIQVAEEYTQKNILKLFKDAKKSSKSETKVQFIKDEGEKLKLVADIAQENYENRKNFSEINGDTESSKGKNLEIAEAISESSTDAIQKADATKGLYVVSVVVEYGKDYDEWTKVLVVLNKDLTVLNKPVDMDAYRKAKAKEVEDILNTK